MALTISTGFVVDDAIVVVENITRYLEQGMKPMEAALKALAQEIGFTVLTISISLIAVFIPLLLLMWWNCGPSLPRVRRRALHCHFCLHATRSR